MSCRPGLSVFKPQSWVLSIQAPDLACQVFKLITYLLFCFVLFTTTGYDPKTLLEIVYWHINLSHARDVLASKNGKTFRMIKYPRYCRHLPPGCVHPVQEWVEQWDPFLDLEHEGVRSKRRPPHLDPLCTLRSNCRLKKPVKHRKVLCSQTQNPCPKKTYRAASAGAFESHICPRKEGSWLIEKEEANRKLEVAEWNSFERVNWEQNGKANKRKWEAKRRDRSVYSKFERSGKCVSFYFVL